MSKGQNAPFALRYDITVGSWREKRRSKLFAVREYYIAGNHKVAGMAGIGFLEESYSRHDGGGGIGPILMVSPYIIVNKFCEAQGSPRLSGELSLLCCYNKYISTTYF